VICHQPSIGERRVYKAAFTSRKAADEEVSGMQLQGAEVSMIILRESSVAELQQLLQDYRDALQKLDSRLLRFDFSSMWHIVL
jgi:hypothetical protein